MRRWRSVSSSYATCSSRNCEPELVLRNVETHYHICGQDDNAEERDTKTETNRENTASVSAVVNYRIHLMPAAAALSARVRSNVVASNFFARELRELFKDVLDAGHLEGLRARVQLLFLRACHNWYKNRHVGRREMHTTQTSNMHNTTLSCRVK